MPLSAVMSLANHDYRRIRRRTDHEHRIDLTADAFRGGADDGFGAQPDPLAGLLGESAGDQHARYFLSASAAVSRRRRVTKDHQVHVEGHFASPPLHGPTAAGVYAVGAGRCVEGFGNYRARVGRLTDQQVACAQIGRARRGECTRGGQSDRGTPWHAHAHGISLGRLCRFRG